MKYETSATCALIFLTSSQVKYKYDFFLSIFFGVNFLIGRHSIKVLTAHASFHSHFWRSQESL